MRGKTQRAVILSCVLKPDFVTQEIVEVSDFYYSPKQIELAQFISSYYFSSLGEALGIMSPFASEILNQVQDDGRVVQDDGRVVLDDGRVVLDDGRVVLDDKRAAHDEHFIRHSELDSESKPTVSKLKLSAKQEKALAFLQKHTVSLLFGDTGSGKTEIYMKYFEQKIAQGKRSLFLMPEISLTPQMSRRLEEHFEESVVMWHSKLTPLQKKKAMAKIYSGEAKIIAGPRSALFLPIKNLGL
ncbi:MAG: DEAD/DEAH box helicase family protein, partial [Sulfurimonas sp.]|nr:DEAD/DEAH box helicase family protein [Sulfurimonas sp.]